MRAQYIGKKQSVPAEYGSIVLANGVVYDISVHRRKSGRVRVIVNTKNRGASSPLLYATRHYDGPIEIPSYDLNWRELPQKGAGENGFE